MQNVRNSFFPATVKARKINDYKWRVCQSSASRHVTARPMTCQHFSGPELKRILKGNSSGALGTAGGSPAIWARSANSSTEGVRPE
jgi:hypothetical protein